MKKGLTELVFILDRSGSMAGLEKDTIGGYNAMLKKQQEVEGEAVITTVLFDNKYELLHDRMDLRGIRPITQKEYYVCGSTALLDAIGKTIHKIGKVQKNSAKEYQAEKVLFIIITDGEENASHRYTAEGVKAQIENQKQKYGWEFIFMGANLDAVKTAASFGIDQNRAQDYCADSEGTEVLFAAVSDAVLSYRKCEAMPEDWNKKIKNDFENRQH